MSDEIETMQRREMAEMRIEAKAAEAAAYERGKAEGWNAAVDAVESTKPQNLAESWNKWDEQEMNVIRSRYPRPEVRDQYEPNDSLGGFPSATGESERTDRRKADEPWLIPARIGTVEMKTPPTPLRGDNLMWTLFLRGRWLVLTDADWRRLMGRRRSDWEVPRDDG